MDNFRGVGRLLLLALRRDRVKLLVWMAVIIGMMAAAVPAIKELYGQDQSGLNQYAMTTASSMVGRMLGGPIDGPQIGSVVMLEYYLFIAVLIAFMSTLAIVRHTRQNEETGRSELIGSAPVGRFSPLTAALVLTVGANLFIAVCLGLILTAYGLSWEGAWAMALSLGGIGLVFAAISAVCAQIVGTSRGANAAAGALIGVAFLVRGLGDGLGKISEDGMSVLSAWPSLLSPIGWGQQMRPFVETNWLLLVPYVATFIILVSLAFWLASHRDYGVGMIAGRLGRARASWALRGVGGLAWRLQRVMVISWTIGIGLLGAMLGLTAVEFKDIFTQNEQMAALLAAMGGNMDNLTDVYFAAMMGMMGFVMAGFALQAILRLQSEEASGYLESLLSTPTGRVKWALSHIGVVVAGLIVMALIAGFSTAVAYAMVADNAWDNILPLIQAAYIQLPAILVLVAIAVVIFGLIPRLSIPIVWGVFAACLLIFQLGSVLKLPQWILDSTPFAHTPSAPADTIDMWPLVAMGGIAVLLVGIGLLLFKRRDSVA